MLLRTSDMSHRHIDNLQPVKAGLVKSIPVAKTLVPFKLGRKERKER